eukprot:COSAG01_NODE_40869_length_458_cov_2.384401_1_plen_101_part_01
MIIYYSHGVEQVVQGRLIPAYLLEALRVFPPHISKLRPAKRQPLIPEPTVLPQALLSSPRQNMWKAGAVNPIKHIATALGLLTICALPCKQRPNQGCTLAL